MIHAESALLTDLYQLTMARAYHGLDMTETAVFELFVRELPPERKFLVNAGLAQVIDYLEGLKFTPEDLEFLSGLGGFPGDFLAYLGTVRFTGSIHAMPEGTPYFANEPILRVTAPILQAQLVESRILNLMHFQTVVASKAVRCVSAAQGRRLADFGMRRAHGAEAAILAARAAYVAGFDATATVEAGHRFGIPLTGTMAHAFIQAHDHEEDALRRFVEIGAQRTTVLIDTYDIQRAAQRVAAMAVELKASRSAGQIQAVRIDSGDLATESRAVRRILDDGGCPEIDIILSGGLDENRIDALVAAGAPANGFGVGTRLDCAEDAPSLDMVYKLEEYAGKGRRKRSRGKATWPGTKQVFRDHGASGQANGDTIALAEEPRSGEPLLREIMRDGRRVGELPTLGEIRDHCRRSILKLPAPLRELSASTPLYPVTISEGVRELAARLDKADR